ncbi:sulfatase-like hydrolase/transferase [Rubritalea tangerina]|uniref:Sulfatase-like hydrolase/transferase n=1 Tax=Rubritalea tangerina TaxID=430798 RepID=A0ABW4ZCL1_9BACT
MKALLSAFLLSVNWLIATDTPTQGIASPAGPTTISLSWNDNANDESGYEIQRHNGDLQWSTVASLPRNAFQHYDRGLTPSTTYYYRLRALGTPHSSWLTLDPATTTIKMNILFFLADDMGYKDIVGLRDATIDGPTIYETPALDQLIADGLSINNAYCSGPRCVVARRSILSGKYDWRPEAIPNNDYYLDHHGDPIGGGLWAGGTTVAGAEVGAGVTIPNDNVTYGEATTADYLTCYIGKYHLGESPSATPLVGYTFGDQPARGPRAQGFDVSIGAGHAGAPPASYFSVENQHNLGHYTFELPDLDDPDFGTTAPVQGEYITDRLTQKAIGFINHSLTANPNDPFFLTLAHYAVHTPAEAKISDINYFKAKKINMAAELATHPMAATPLITDTTTKTRMLQDNFVYAAMLKSYDDSIAALRAHLAATDDPRNPGKKLSETTIIIVSSDHGGKSTTPIDDNKPLEDDNSDPFNPSPTFDAVSGTYKSGTPNAYSSYPTSNYPYRQGKTWVYEGGLKIPLIVYYPGLTTAGSRSNAFVHGADFFSTFVDMAGAPQNAEATDSISFMQTLAEPTRAARTELHHFFTNANKGTGNPAIAAYRKGDYKLLYFMVQRKLELYNLAADPYEQNDLAATRPELADEMLKQIYDQFLSTGGKMPKPGSNTWSSEQQILVDNGFINALPALPDAPPSDLTLTTLSDTTIQLDWNVNASNATHNIIYRRSDPDAEDSYREIAFLPITTTTFIDTELSPGGKYRYRVESENLAGWATSNTGNKTLTLTNSGSTLPALAADDSITTVPGELRIIYPLINDQGEGALQIQSVTTPTIGAAVHDGSRIFYQAPENFASNATLSYTLIDEAGQTSTATVTLTLPIPKQGTSLEHWDFDETALSQLENTQSNSGLTFYGATSPKVATNGSGQLLLQQDSKNHNRNSNAISGAPYSSGSFTLNYHLSSLDLTNSQTGASLGFGFRDDLTKNDIALARLRLVSGTLVLEARHPSTTLLYAFPSNTSTLNNATVSITLDLDADTFTTALTLNGSEAFTPITLPTNPVAPQLTAIKFQGNQDASLWAASDTAAVDYLEIIQNATTNTLYHHWAATYPWDGERLTAPLDDPDADGLSNIIEFAFGSPPNLTNSSSPISIDPATLQINFTPIRDTTHLHYQVEFSNDLNDWSSTPPQLITTPANTPVQVDLPSNDKSFGRVTVGSNPQ